MELYVLYLEMYHEWANECGACDLIGVFDTKEQAVKELIKCINNEFKDGHYVDYVDYVYDGLKAYKNNEENDFYVDIYEDKIDFDNGHNMGTFVIKKKSLNDSEVFI